MLNPSDFIFGDSPAKSHVASEVRNLPQRSLDEIAPWMWKEGARPTSIHRVAFVSRPYTEVPSDASLYAQLVLTSVRDSRRDMSVLRCVVTEDPRTSFAELPPDNSGVDANTTELRVGLNDVAHFRQLAAFININRVDAICVNFGYGMYGTGDLTFQNIIALLRDLTVPAVTVLHDLCDKPTKKQRDGIARIAELSSLLVVPLAELVSALRSPSAYFLPAAHRVAVVPGGAHTALGSHIAPRRTRAEIMRLRGDLWHSSTSNLTGPCPQVLGVISSGPLLPRGGSLFCVLETIREMGARGQLPAGAVFLVVGHTDPSKLASEGTAHRNALMHAVRTSTVEGAVAFECSSDLTVDEVTQWIAAADFCIVPDTPVDATYSWATATSMICGTRVLSGPNRFVLSHTPSCPDDDGATVAAVPSTDTDGYAAVLLDWLTKPPQEEALVESVGGIVQWSVVAERMRAALEDARLHQVIPSILSQKPPTPLLVAPHEDIRATPPWSRSPEGITEPIMSLPEVNIDHLLRMTDHTGLIQFANGDIPDFSSGYCTDDNARALTVALKLRRLWGVKSPKVRINGGIDIADVYLAFLRAAQDRSICRFRNFMSYGRKWVDPNDLGSEESHGRAVQALGHAVGYRFHVEEAREMFITSLPALYTLTSPRAFAHAMDGAYHFLQTFPGNTEALQLLTNGGEMLLRLYQSVCERHLREAGLGQSTPQDDWKWFEDVLTYSNSSLCMAMLEAGEVLNRNDFTECGLESLHWLFTMQIHPTGPRCTVFSPIGCQSWQHRSDRLQHPQHDQQPIEACTFVLAALAAHRVTRDAKWRNAAALGMEWFFGKNTTGVPLYDRVTGGCCDGLHPLGSNANQGAESLLCYLMSLAAWHESQHDGTET